MRFSTTQCWIALLFQLLALHATADYVPPIMPGLTAEWIARDVTHNGVAMRMQRLQGRVSVAMVGNHYQELWRDSGYRVRVRRSGGWRQYSIQPGKEFVTLMLRATQSGSEGYLTVSELPGSTSRVESSRVPLPSGVRVIARQTHDDGPKTAETLTLASYQQPTALAIGFHNALTASGWVRQSAGPARTVDSGYVAHYGGDDGLIKLFVHRDPAHYEGQSLVLLHRFGGR